jgi:hypothetical protein
MTDEERAKIREAVDAACEGLVSYSDEGAGPLWHYCGADGCEGIIVNDEIWATHYGYTNDTEELERGERLLVDVLQGLEARETDPVKKGLYKSVAHSLPGQQLTDMSDVYLACFTEADDANELTQWSGYGHKGTGYALQLGIQGPVERDGAALAGMLVKVIYSDDAFKAAAETALARHADACAAIGPDAAERGFVWMMRQCAALSPRLKHPCFAHEKEWRLIAAPLGDDRTAEVFFRKRGNNFVPFVKLALGKVVRRVVVGPAHAGEAQGRLFAVKLLLERNGYRSRLAETSEIPFRA